MAKIRFDHDVERAYGTPDLEQIIVTFVQLFGLVAHENESPKLRLVVTEVDSFCVLAVTQ